MSQRRSLRSISNRDDDDLVAKKRKRQVALAAAALQEEPKRPRVHAQRKFAQGQGISGSSALNSPMKERPSGNGSSSSSTASGPVTKSSDLIPPGGKKGERPKTEDFLTFLCLRGTNLLPPELDFFNQASLSQVHDSSGEDESSDEQRPSGGVAKKTTVQRKVTKKDEKKKLPSAVQALKKKYTEQRLANEGKMILAKKIPSTRSRSSPDKGVTTRSSLISRRTRSGASHSKLSVTTRKPSAAAIIAKRKTRMAMASKQAHSRMLTRLTPRGTSNAAFVKHTKKLPLGSRSLRGRDISMSSEEEEEEESEEEELPKRKKRKSRKEEEEAEEEETDDDADEENSSNSSIRKTRKSEEVMKRKPVKPTCQLTKREMRSESRDSSVSSRKSTETNQRPSRKTKEAATVYLNLLGQKLTSKNDEDAISIGSLNEATQEKRLGELETESRKGESRKRNSNEDSDRESVKSKNGKPKTPKKDSATSQADKEKKKQKVQSLRELQDRLLEEAKKKIASSSPINEAAGPAAPAVGDSDTGDSDERITISQKTGYIQVKPRKSTEQDEPPPTTVPAASIASRRLSKNGERVSTPPRKILPKTDLDSSRDGSPLNRPHLPVGVMGAALSSSRISKQPNVPPTIIATPTIAVATSQTANQVPLTQPLVINTSFPTAVTPTKNPIIMQPAGIRMGAVPIQVRPAMPIITAGSTGILGPIAFPTAGSIIQAPQTSVTQPISTKPIQQQTILRPQFGFATQSVITQGTTITQPIMIPASQSTAAAIQPQNLLTTTSKPQLVISRTVISSTGGTFPVLSQVVTSTNRSATDVTTSNTQPLVSPGPPMLSPQTTSKKKAESKNPPVLTSQSQAPIVLPQHPQPMTQLHSKQQYFQPPFPPQQQPFIPPPGSFNPYQQVQYAYANQVPPPHAYSAPTTQLPPNLPQHPLPQQQQASQNPKSIAPKQPSTPQQRPEKHQRTIFSKASGKASNVSSFKVENESSPYAFEPEPNEQRPSKPVYRKPNFAPDLPSPKSSKSKSHASTPSSKAPKSKRGKAAGKATEDPTIAVQCNMEDSSSSSSPEMGGSIPIPAELASQLAAQASKDGASGNAETTYFIPLQSSSGQSFGVAVKLGTEGPAGPNQKVIVKAKLVTQPAGKNVGARVIGGRDSKVKSPPSSPPLKKSDRKFSRMPVASPASSDDDDDSDAPSTSTGRVGSPEHSRRKAQPTDEQSCLGSVHYVDRFPKLGPHAQLVEAPVYRPTEEEFKDPLRYISKIRAEAEPFGICKIIPPKSFVPECNVDDDMRFTAYNQYIHRMMNRWGPNSKELAAIKKYLETQSIEIKTYPVIGGLEIDLPALYHAVQSFGGLTEVIQKKKWSKIAEFLRLPKGTRDVGKKLDDIYCKYLLPYDTLSEVERGGLLRLVEEEWEEDNKQKLERSKNEEGSDDEEEEESDDEDHECVVKGKSTSLSQFYRVARNLMTMVFKDSEPHDVRDVEEEYWRLVIDRDCHIQVQQGSIDTGVGPEGFGFPTSRNSSCGRHPWNLKILSNNPRSLLRCMGPVMGVTVPTLHVGMLFTTGCWYRDPHGLPWVEYHHTGAAKIWYGIPDSHSIAFYTAMKQLVPTFCRNKKMWLPSDTAMVPPNLLVKYGVSVCRTVQEPGQFMIVFPKAYTSSLCTGYSVSESVYFAPKDYLSFAETEFQDIKESIEPMMFPLPKLFLTVAQDEYSTKDTLRLVKPHLERIRDSEYVKRAQITDMGVKNSERIDLRGSKKKQEEDDEYECERCSANLYVSFLCDIKEDTYFCLEHAIEYLQEKKTQKKHCKVLYTHSRDEITAIIKAVNKRIEDVDESSSSDDDVEIKPRIIEVKEVKVEPPKVKSELLQRGQAKKSDVSPSIPSTNKGKTPVAKKDPPPVSAKGKAPIAKKEPRPVPKKAEAKKPETKSKSKSSSAVKESTSKRRKTTTRRAATQDRSGNLTSEILDMLLSSSESRSEESESEEEDSDDSWK